MKGKRLPLGKSLRSPFAAEMNKVFKPKTIKAKKGTGSYKRKARTIKEII